MRTGNHFISSLVVGLIAVAALIVLSCSHTRKLPAIGEALPDDVPARSESFMIVTSASSTSEVYWITRDNIEYNVAVDGDRRIAYIGTSDPDFKTAEGIKIGTPLKDVLKLTDSELSTESGWGFYVRLKSGWNAAFAVGDSMTDSLPDENHPIDWFFKR